MFESAEETSGDSSNGVQFSPSHHLPIQSDYLDLVTLDSYLSTLAWYMEKGT